MCLMFYSSYSQKPAEGRFRYKLVSIDPKTGGLLPYYDPMATKRAYFREKWNVARWQNLTISNRFRYLRRRDFEHWQRDYALGCYIPSKLQCYGFHVFVFDDPEPSLGYSERHTELWKVEVKGFIATGMFGGDLAETWQLMRFVEKVRDL